MKNLNTPIFDSPCPICMSKDFSFKPILWEKLIKDWELNRQETDYINRQQGLVCNRCGCNLRVMALAQGILHFTRSKVNFFDFCQKSELHVLEINKVGNLTPILSSIKNHLLIEFPDFDMMNLSLDSNSFDIVLHSDTLEHIKEPIIALQECRRILKPGGACIFTVPIIINRLSKSRSGLSKSYHGSEAEKLPDHLVWTEFGADIWNLILQAGFLTCEIFCLEFPSGICLIAKKESK